jgi:hypothetical protein
LITRTSKKLKAKHKLPTKLALLSTYAKDGSCNDPEREREREREGGKWQSTIIATSCAQVASVNNHDTYIIETLHRGYCDTEEPVGG